ncbi:hypothetical protein ACOMHN_034501 [Nucella lapillus]
MSIMIRPESGTKTRAANQIDINKCINELKQDLTRSRGETQRARDKLTCLISLVRRSWNGDRNASIHLANIIGLDIPPFLLDSGTVGRSSTRMQTPSMNAKTPAVVNWERLAVKLLQRDYDLVQTEIREHQRRYIENRSSFMDEVMLYHQQDMARLPLSRPSSGKLSSVDHQFLQMHSMVKQDGRNETRQRLYRPKSSTLRTKAKVDRDIVQQAEVKLRDLFVESSNPPAVGSALPAASLAGVGTKETEPVRQRRLRQDYDDSRRYVQGHLFQAEDMVGKRTRPMSAMMQRDKDRMRARPRSAVITMDGAATDASSGDRPLKYETTRPVSGKRASSAKARKGSASSMEAQLQTNNNNVNNASEGTHTLNVSFAEFVPEDDEMEPASQTPPISVRVRNAVTRPECVDKFSEDLRHMEEMEAQFKMDTLSLQRKLGLPQSGIV